MEQTRLPIQRVGIIGCGNISAAYLANAKLFKTFAFMACSDLNPTAAAARAAEFGIEALSVDDLLQRPDIDIVLNLTIPSVHAEVSNRALCAGKHVYTEKPLATSVADGEGLVRLAERQKLLICSAPDTVLGPGTQLARRLIAEGLVGDIVTGTAATMSIGMEHWHPNPAFFYQKGGGPLLDLGPYYMGALTTLLGPVNSVYAHGRIGRKERLVTAAGSQQGKTISVDTLTSINALLTFVNGAIVTLTTSWDVWRHGLPPIELHGTLGSLRSPDPNWFGGVVETAAGRGGWVASDTRAMTFGEPNYAWDGSGYANYRGLGLADMSKAIATGCQPRCTGSFALHALRAMLGILESADKDKVVKIDHNIVQPAPLSELEAQSLASSRF